MKYKRLNPEELKALEKEFVNFLASAQITGSDWIKMKANELEKAEELIEVFSDVVYDKILRKIKYLEYRDAKTLNIFHCADDKIVLAGMRIKENSQLDFTAPDFFAKWNADDLSMVNVVKSEKKYIKERELEVFELLQNGCLITDDKLFNALNKNVG